jgi:hypothetical protein
VSNSSNSLSHQELLQYVAAIPNYIHCIVFLEMQITTISALKKPNFCAVFKGQIPCFIYIDFNIPFAKMHIHVSSFLGRLITHILYMKYQDSKSILKVTTVALFNSLPPYVNSVIVARLCVQNKPNVPVQLSK